MNLPLQVNNCFAIDRGVYDGHGVRSSKRLKIEVMIET